MPCSDCTDAWCFSGKRLLFSSSLFLKQPSHKTGGFASWLIISIVSEMKENEGRSYQIAVTAQASRCLVWTISAEFVEHLAVVHTMWSQNKGTYFSPPWRMGRVTPVTWLTPLWLHHCNSSDGFLVQKKHAKAQVKAEAAVRVTGVRDSELPWSSTLSLVTTDNGRNFLWCTFFTVQNAERAR